jgi:hypothetical protein
MSRRLAVGVTLGIIAVAAVAATQKTGVTNVRVGPTAAVALATSAVGSIVYVASGNGVYKSSDAGETWTKLPVE